MKKIIYWMVCMFMAMSSMAIEIHPEVLPDGGIGYPYYEVLSASGGTDPYTWSCWSLPEGLSLSTSNEYGVISGIPTEAFDGYTEIQVSDNSSGWGYIGFEWEISGDWDQDGMTDQWEQVIVDANPSDAINEVGDVLRDDNYDGDEFLNIEEYILGFNPVLPDGNTPDSIIEGLMLIKKASTNDLDAAYFSMIDGCFSSVISNEPFNYSARVYRMLSRLLNLVNDDELRGLIEQFGGILADNFMVSGGFDFDSAPLVDAAIDVAIPEVLAAIDASYADLNAIPEDWTGYAEFSMNYFPVDETVYIDIADITVLKSLLNLARSVALTIQAQQLNVDYEKMVMPIDVPVASITVDGNADDWAGVPCHLIGEVDSAIEYVKGVRGVSSIYLLAKLRDTSISINGVYADISLGRDSEVDMDYYGNEWWNQTNIHFSATGTNTASFILVDKTNSFLEIEIPVPTGIVISNACVLGFDIYGEEYNEQYGYWEWNEDEVEFPGSLPSETLLGNHPEFMSKVRSESDLDNAKTNLQEAIDLFQKADGLIHARSDVLMHLIEYDPTNAADRVEFFTRLQEGENSLSGPIEIVGTNEMGEVNFDEEVYWGAFYQPDYLTRAMLPDFYEILTEPVLDDFPDPTFGGIFPEMTQVHLSESMQMWGISNEPIGITVVGTATVYEVSLTQYECFAYYRNGAESNITDGTVFSLDSAYANISSNGQLNAGEVEMNRIIHVNASFQGMSDSLEVIIKDTTLPEALNNSELSWFTGGSANWFGQSAETFDGIGAARSGEIDDAEVSWLETTINGSGTLSFYWKVSSEERFDWLWFLVDDSIEFIASGERGWQQESVDVDGAGTHTLRWEYYKDKDLSLGLDGAWIDQVVWMPDLVGFAFWANGIGLSGDLATLFSQDHDGDGVPNGLEYAFGTNLQDKLLLKIKIVGGSPLVEIPTRDSASLSFVDVALKGSTNLVEWTYPIILTNGAPSGCEWYRSEGEASSSFFKLEAELK